MVGIPNHGTLRIGDTLTEGEEDILFFFEAGDGSRIWEIVGRTVIDADGALMIRRDWYENACNEWQDVYAEEGIIQEPCGLDG